MLKRVKIRGYKSLVDVEVHLQPLSVFFGPNASGKSNFLDALQLLSRIATSNNLNDAFRHLHPEFCVMVQSIKARSGLVLTFSRCTPLHKIRDGIHTIPK